MTLKHIIFDLDGTLWNTTKISAMAYNHALREDGRCPLHVTPEIICQEFGKPMDVIADDLFPDFEPEVRASLMEKCNKANTAFLERTDQNVLFPDVHETLDRLSHDCRLYIVSNCQPGYIEMFLRKYQLEPYITDIECFGNTGKYKAENIRLLMERNHIGEAVYVGDTDGDYRAASQAGIPFIHAAYGYGRVSRRTCFITHFAQLLELQKNSDGLTVGS